MPNRGLQCRLMVCQPSCRRFNVTRDEVWVNEICSFAEECARKETVYIKGVGALVPALPQKAHCTALALIPCILPFGVAMDYKS